MSSKLEQLKALRERGQGGVRAESRTIRKQQLEAFRITKAMLERAASAIPPKPKKKRRM